MPNLVVTYLKLTGYADNRITGQPMATEAFDGFSEALIPRTQAFPTFCVKKFHGQTCRRWRIDSVAHASPAGEVPTRFEVYLSEAPALVPEEYLHETLRKTSKRPHDVLFHGTLVEVDFGFASGVALPDGSIRDGEGYFDGLQHGEMHKRRLAVVTAAGSDATVQVVPVTTVEHDEKDKSSFRVTSLPADLVHYNAKDPCWALCGMVQSIGTQRILPPLSHYQARGMPQQGRHQSYPLRLNGNDVRSLKSAMAHASGVSDYEALRQMAARQAEVAAENERLTTELRQAAVFRQVALDAQATPDDAVALVALAEERWAASAK